MAGENSALTKIFGYCDVGNCVQSNTSRHSFFQIHYLAPQNLALFHFMAKIIRHSYPKELSVGLLLLVFVVSFFLSGGIFAKNQPDLNEVFSVSLGEFLVAGSMVIMVMILWEEVLFPVKVKPAPEGGAVFRNHRTKLLIQALIYLTIPVIVVFIYVTYAVNAFRFFAWAGVCTIVPVVGKLASGIRNYNDFLKLTKNKIEYKNNQEVGSFELKDIQSIELIKDERKVLHKVQVHLTSGTQVTIDLDEMELEAYYESIDKFITNSYGSLLK